MSNSTPSDTIACALGSALADPNRRTMIAMDPRDTDGDGISDLAEVLGSDISEGPFASASGGCIAGGSPVPLSDADQTFPLWGFNPRHKDMLIEADRQVARDWTLVAPVAPAIATCTSPTHGVAPDSVAWPPMLPSAGAVYQQENSRIGQALLRVQNHFNSLRGDRLGNPDGLPGIKVHFDIRLPRESSFGHGTIPRFWILDPSGNVVTDLVAYIPGTETSGAWRIGSTAGCGRTSICPAQRHGGYSHYLLFDDTALSGGGQSGTDSVITATGADADAWSHETGHHLGLGHGSPVASIAGVANPFAPLSPDGAQGKLAHVSIMNYRYMWYTRLPEALPYSSMASFSSGARSAFPVPRQVSGSGNAYVVPEFRMFGERTPSTLTDPAEVFSFLPQSCNQPGNRDCVDVDVDRDGTISSTGVVVSTTAADGTGYRKGLGVIDSYPNWWCPSERRAVVPGAAAPAGTQCCATGTALADGTCSSGVRPGSELMVDNTPMLAGQPVAVVANNRFYSMYWDHSWRDQFNDCRCAPSDPTCLQSYCHDRTLRWSAWDRLQPPAGSTQNPHCFSEDCRSVNAGAQDRGWVLFDGQRLYLRGMTVSGAATIASSSPGTETVVLGYSSRSAQCPNRNSSGVQLADQCGQTWTSAKIYFGPRAAA